MALSLAEAASGSGWPPIAWLGWLAVGSAAAASAAKLWDGRGRGVVAGLYLLGLCGSGWLVAQFHLPGRWLVWTGTMALAAYSVAASYLWSRRAGFRTLADRLAIPRPAFDDPDAGHGWLVPANLGLAGSVLFLAFGTILTEPLALMRNAAGQAALAQALAVGLLAHGARRSRLQLTAMGVGVAGVIASGWAWVAPDSPSGLLDRAAVVLVVLVGASAIYGLGLSKLFPEGSEWARAGRRLVPALLAFAGITTALICGAETLARVEGRAALMSPAAIAAVAGALAGAAAAAVVAAVVPGRDPLGLSERGRTAYVYAAEAVLAILALHIRVTLPWLFTGLFARYWSLAVLGLAFLGAGLGEVFRRRGQNVLADPLGKTGAMLPLLPIAAAFFHPPTPGQDVAFLALTGLLYATFSYARASSRFAALSALAFNGMIWTVLAHRGGLGLAQHPQLWVIPPALCVLAGAYLNRDRLTSAQITAVRYAASLAVYLSSTLDILLTGVAQAPWLPLALAGLSVLGIFAGIALRVRAFLFLGVGFLTLALFTIVWYAAVDLRQTWIWAASGIVAGLLILALFALFEKKRDDFLKVGERLKGWEA